MTLEELLQAMNLAVAEAAKDPENKELKAKAELATKQYNDAKELSDLGEFDEDKADAKTKAYLKKLRQENASHRTANKDLKSKVQSEIDKRNAILKAAGIEIESENPAEKLKTVTAESQQHAFRNAVLESALQHGIPGDQIDYYEFLIAKATGALDEGEELSDEALAEIVGKIKKSSTQKSATSTVDGSKTPPPGTKDDQITLDKFLSMSISEKSALYLKNPDQYAGFVAEAKAKKKSLV